MPILAIIISPATTPVGLLMVIDADVLVADVAEPLNAICAAACCQLIQIVKSTIPIQSKMPPKYLVAYIKLIFLNVVSAFELGPELILEFMLFDLEVRKSIKNYIILNSII